MRLFFIGWGDDHPEMVELVFDLQEHGHDIVYWSRDDAHFFVDESKFPKTIFHTYRDAVVGVPARGVPSFGPPSEELIAKLYECESLVVTMMNKKYNWMTVSERKHLYYRFVGYWDGVLRAHRPDLIMFPVPPHALYDYVIYSLARLYGIPMYMFSSTVIHDRLLYLSDYVQGSEAMKKALQEVPVRSVGADDLSADLHKYYLRETAPEADKPPHYHALTMKEYSLKKKIFVKMHLIIRSARDGTFLRRLFGYIVKQFRPNIRDEYIAVEKEPDFEAKFIYVPLHFQPESSTTPQGGVFTDQLLMVETLSAALPEGWRLYVKEHPAQWLQSGLNFSGYRYSGFYRDLAGVANTTVVPIATDTFTLTRRAQATATVTGTAAWESILRGKPAIYFGYPWYAGAPGTYRAHDVASAREAFEKIRAQASVSKEDVLRFLFAFDRASVRGYLNEYSRSVSDLTRAENKMNLRLILDRRIAEVSARPKVQKQTHI